MDHLLPNGSILLLHGGNKKLMIHGRKQLLVTNEENEHQMYDYVGVPYPEGYISPEYTYVFNHNDIAKVIFTGFVNEEEVEFKAFLTANETSQES
ncbi:DUF4176 domain-containing protein [Metabacillus iocasae]|uniref:DUF4176 domain-containing protein n=1 Tax=Priestia iocasae TaxID=2291674 RepID=A0ABS2QUW0_9BACI|nr:DUF4176 domain-containing protein [Metabacillus iocasae]MBM7703284.1 hypothetical protein [Metabacillus iocasae]